MLTNTDVYVDQALSNVSIKYSNDSFIADKIFPIVPVKKQTGKYYVYDKSNLRVDTTARAAGSGANEVDIGVAPSGTYSCNDHALKSFVADEIQDQADAALNPLIDETEALTEKLLLDREINLANSLSSTGVLTNNVTLSGTTQWSDYVNSDPIGDIRTARTTIHQNTFKKPNTLILGKQVFDMLIEHPQIIERVKYSQLGVITEELLARVFQVETVLVGEAGSNIAKEGQTDSLSYVWGKNAVVAYISKKISIKMLTLGVTFTYSVRQSSVGETKTARVRSSVSVTTTTASRSLRQPQVTSSRTRSLNNKIARTLLATRRGVRAGGGSSAPSTAKNKINHDRRCTARKNRTFQYKLIRGALPCESGLDTGYQATVIF